MRNHSEAEIIWFDIHYFHLQQLIPKELDNNSLMFKNAPNYMHAQFWYTSEEFMFCVVK